MSTLFETAPRAVGGAWSGGEWGVALLAQFVPPVCSVDVVQARRVGSKEREQCVSVASLAYQSGQLPRVDLTTAISTVARRGALITHCVVAPLVASLLIEDRRTRPAIALLRLPLVIGVPEIVGPVIAPIVIVALALASAPTIIVAAPLVVPPVIVPFRLIAPLRLAPPSLLVASAFVALLRSAAAAALLAPIVHCLLDGRGLVVGPPSCWSSPLAVLLRPREKAAEAKAQFSDLPWAASRVIGDFTSRFHPLLVRPASGAGRGALLQPLSPSTHRESSRPRRAPTDAK